MKVLTLLLYLSIILIISCDYATNNYGHFTSDDVEMVNINSAQMISSTYNEAIHIDLNTSISNREMSELNIVDTMFFIPLQTTSESIFFDPYKILFCNDRIYIQDKMHNIIIFAQNGDFVKRLKKGDGPGEINRIMSVATDNDTEQLIVIQGGGFLTFFDKNGDYTEQKVRCPLNTQDFFITEWGYLLYQSHFENYHLGENAEYALLLADKNMKVFSKGINVTNSYSYVYKGSMTFPKEDSYYVSQFMNDTIFEISKHNKSDIRPKYILDYENCKVSDNEDFTKSKKFYNNSCVIENEQTMLLHFYSSEYGLCTVIRDRITGNILSGTQIYGNYYTLPAGYLSRIYAVHNDYFVAYIPPYKGMHYNDPAISDVDNQKIANLDDEDNGFLAFFKFKKF